MDGLFRHLHRAKFFVVEQSCAKHSAGYGLRGMDRDWRGGHSLVRHFIFKRTIRFLALIFYRHIDWFHYRVKSRIALITNSVITRHAVLKKFCTRCTTRHLPCIHSFTNPSIMKYWSVCTAVFCFMRLAAQDTHYGTQQFGTRSALLGGAVVGGTRDNSMIFYNPAAVAFIDSSSFSINANVYQVENTEIKNILTDVETFKSLQLTSVPLLTSGQFKTKIPNFRVSYGIFSPVAFQFRGQARLSDLYPVVDDAESPGGELFTGDEILFSRLRELNVAIGVSYKLGDHWAIGLTNIVAVRSQNYNRAIASYFTLNNAERTLVHTSLTQSMNYFNVRYMPKLGLAYSGANWSWGATVTGPGVRVLGTGAVGVDLVATNVKVGTEPRQTVAANNRQTKLKSYFKSPYSVATGFELHLGKMRYLASAQYFGKQSIFSIMHGTNPPYVNPTSAAILVNNGDLLQVQSAARAVVNIAVGLERDLNERWRLAASVRSNPSYYDPALLQATGIKPDITTWDLYHASAGVTIRKERSSMSLGLTAGFGRDNDRSDQYLPLPQETNFFKSPISTTQATYTSLGVLVGYNYFFKKG